MSSGIKGKNNNDRYLAQIQSEVKDKHGRFIEDKNPMNETTNSKFLLEESNANDTLSVNMPDKPGCLGLPQT
jgi:hypothetical protein